MVDGMAQAEDAKLLIAATPSTPSKSKPALFAPRLDHRPEAHVTCR